MLCSVLQTCKGFCHLRQRHRLIIILKTCFSSLKSTATMWAESSTLLKLELDRFNTWMLSELKLLHLMNRLTFLLGPLIHWLLYRRPKYRRLTKPTIISCKGSKTTSSQKEHQKRVSKLSTNLQLRLYPNPSPRKKNRLCFLTRQVLTTTSSANKLDREPTLLSKLVCTNDLAKKLHSKFMKKKKSKTFKEQSLSGERFDWWKESTTRISYNFTKPLRRKTKSFLC